MILHTASTRYDLDTGGCFWTLDRPVQYVRYAAGRRTRRIFSVRESGCAHETESEPFQHVGPPALMYPIVRSGTLAWPSAARVLPPVQGLLLADNAQHFYSLDYDVVL